MVEPRDSIDEQPSINCTIRTITSKTLLLLPIHLLRLRGGSVPTTIKNFFQALPSFVGTATPHEMVRLPRKWYFSPEIHEQVAEEWDLRRSGIRFAITFHPSCRRITSYR